MKILIFVLNNSELLSPLLKEFNSIGIKGCTIFDSSGIGRELAKQDELGMMFGTLHSLLKPDVENTKTLMLILNEDKIESVISSIEKIVGNLEDSGTGILFTFSPDIVKGIKL